MPANTQSAATPTFSFACQVSLEFMIFLHALHADKHAYRVRSLQVLTFLGLPFLLTIATCDSHTTDLLGARSCQSLLIRPVSQILCTSKGSASATASKITRASHTRPCCKPPVLVSGCVTVAAHEHHVSQLLHMNTMCHTYIRPHALCRAPKLRRKVAGISAACLNGSKGGGGDGVSEMGGGMVRGLWWWAEAGLALKQYGLTATRVRVH